MAVPRVAGPIACEGCPVVSLLVHQSSPLQCRNARASLEPLVRPFARLSVRKLADERDVTREYTNAGDLAVAVRSDKRVLVGRVGDQDVMTPVDLLRCRGENLRACISSMQNKWWSFAIPSNASDGGLGWLRFAVTLNVVLPQLVDLSPEAYVRLKRACQRHLQHRSQPNAATLGDQPLLARGDRVVTVRAFARDYLLAAAPNHRAYSAERVIDVALDAFAMNWLGVIAALHQGKMSGPLCCEDLRPAGLLGKLLTRSGQRSSSFVRLNISTNTCTCPLRK